MSLAQMRIDDFLDRLASDAPTPGGGSVAALTGALAVALGQMACALTSGKPKFAAVEPQVRSVAERLYRAGQSLRKLMDEDAEAYQLLSAALRQDKADPQRTERVQQAAWLAGQVPLETAGFCAIVLAILKELRPIGNPLLRSDMEAAMHLATAAILAASANVRANLPLMSAESAAFVEKQLAALLPPGAERPDAASGRTSSP
jgi:formiminotetrahydrofolate cyclodeaminase